MIKNAKAFVLQPLAATMFLIVALLGASIEIGVKRSHWYDVLAGFILGSLQAIYQVSYRTNQKYYGIMLNSHIIVTCMYLKSEPPTKRRILYAMF